MPAIYAHYRFGKEVSRRLEGELKQVVRKHEPQFRIGLQGPDVLFFYKPYRRNRVAKYGINMHAVSAKPFFEHALSIIREKGRNSREYAYLLGFLCHYILDSECHPYVSEMIEKTGVQHMEIEEEFEKQLLRMDQENPFSYRLDKLIPTDELTAAVISPFYTNISAEVMKEALRTCKMVKQLFRAKGPVKRSLLNLALKLSGQYKSFKGLVHQSVDHPKCKISNEGLQKRFDHAVDIAVDMMHSFDESVKTERELNVRFDRTFE